MENELLREYSDQISGEHERGILRENAGGWSNGSLRFFSHLYGAGPSRA